MIWYCVYSLPQAEWAVSRRLRLEGHDTLFLHYTEPVRHARRTRTVTRPLFPRYVFVALDPSQGLYNVSKTIGVHSIVGMDGPEEIPEAVIAELRKRGDANGFCTLTPEEKQLRKRLRKGDKVRIEHGSLTGLMGTVIMDSGPAVKLWVERMKVFVHPEQLSPARAARQV